MIEIPLEAAYKEACQALGEEIVRGRFLDQAVSQLQPNQEAPSLEDVTIVEGVDSIKEPEAPKTDDPAKDKEAAKGAADVQADKQGQHGNNGRVASTPAAT